MFPLHLLFCCHFNSLLCGVLDRLTLQMTDQLSPPERDISTPWGRADSGQTRITGGDLSGRRGPLICCLSSGSGPAFVGKQGQTGLYLSYFEMINGLFVDKGEARGCSINTVFIKYLTKWPCVSSGPIQLLMNIAMNEYRTFVHSNCKIY